MFLKPEQQLERCKRIVRQRVDPHIHPSIAQLAVESFDIPGEPMPTDEFFAKLNRGDIDFKPFTLGSEWGDGLRRLCICNAGWCAAAGKSGDAGGKGGGI